MTINKIIFSASLLLIIGSAKAQKYVNDYLNIGVGARGMAMSNAQVASVKDITSSYYNPAGLMYVENDFQLGFMHSEYFNGIGKYDYLGVAFPMKNKKGMLGASIIRLAIDDIPNTINIMTPDGGIDYSKIKSMSASDYAGLITYARPISFKKFKDRDDIQITAGGNFKLIHRTLSTIANAWGAGIDVGIQANIKRWKIGLMAKDITTTYTVWAYSLTDVEKAVFASSKNEIVSRSSEINSPQFVAGVARNFPLNKKLNLLAEANFNISTDGKRYGNIINIKPFSIDPKLGVELSYNKLFYLRGGMGNFQTVLDNTDTTNKTKATFFSPTVGLGVILKKNIEINYALTSLNIQDSPLYTHVFSFIINMKTTNKGEKKKLNEQVERVNQSINTTK
jgi:hypothetical protein